LPKEGISVEEEADVNSLMEDVDHFDDIDEDDSGKADGNSRTKDGVEVERKEVVVEEKETEDVSVTDVSVTDDGPAAKE
jgi:hypothetical protein